VRSSARRANARRRATKAGWEREREKSKGNGNGKKGRTDEVDEPLLHGRWEAEGRHVDLHDHLALEEVPATKAAHRDVGVLRARERRRRGETHSHAHAQRLAAQSV
jgi:hypothetical protein